MEEWEGKGHKLRGAITQGGGTPSFGIVDKMHFLSTGHVNACIMISTVITLPILDQRKRPMA